jgi:catechol 2,3-dioxygenase-like lactoylglutathione lyase family enzyme
MRITVTSVFVDDQDAALAFYVDVLGFEKRHDVPMGEHRWLTVVEPGGANPVELLLEPAAHPAVRPFKEALVADGIPFTQFGVDDVAAEHERLTVRGVRFVREPTTMGNVTVAVLDDTQGNLVQLIQVDEGP